MSVSSKMNGGEKSKKNLFLQRLDLLDICLQKQTEIKKHIDPSLLDVELIITTLESLWIQSLQYQFKEDEDGSLPAKYLGKLLEIVNYNKIAQNQECLNLIWSCIIQVICNAQTTLKFKLLDLLQILVEIMKESFAMVQPLPQVLPVFQAQQSMYISVLQLLLKMFPQNYSLKSKRYFKMVPKILKLMCEILSNPDSGVLVRCVAASIVLTLLKICHKNKIDDPMFSCAKNYDCGYDTESDFDSPQKAGIKTLFDVLCLAFELNITAAVQEDNQMHVLIGSKQDSIYQCVLYIMETYPSSALTSLLVATHNLKEKRDQVLFMLMPQAISLLNQFGHTVDHRLLESCLWAEHKNITSATLLRQQLDTDEESSVRTRKVLDPIVDPQFIVFGNLVKGVCGYEEMRSDVELTSIISLSSKNELQQITGFWMLGCMAAIQPSSIAIKDCLTTNRFLYNHSIAHWCVTQYLDSWLKIVNSCDTFNKVKIECAQQWITDILKNIIATEKVKIEEQITLTKIRELWIKLQQNIFLSQDCEDLNAEKVLNILIEFRQIQTLHFLLKYRFFSKAQIQVFTIKVYNVDKLTQVLSEVQIWTCFEIIKELQLIIYNFGEQILTTVELQIKRLLQTNEKNKISVSQYFQWTQYLIYYLIFSEIDQSTIFLNRIFNILQKFLEYFARADLGVFLTLFSNISSRFNDKNFQNSISEDFLDDIFSLLINCNISLGNLEQFEKKFEIICGVVQKLAKSYWQKKCLDVIIVKNSLEWFFEQMDGTLALIVSCRKITNVWSYLPILVAQFKCASTLLKHFRGQMKEARKLMRVLINRLQILWSIKDFNDCSCEANSIQRVVLQCLQEIIYMPLFKQSYEHKFYAEWLFTVLFFAVEEIQILYFGLSRHLIDFLEQKLATIQRIQSLPDQLL